MKRNIVVREFARIAVGTGPQVSLDDADVPESAFEWLCREHARVASRGAALVQMVDRRALRLDNYVGVVETPCGTTIEILPKVFDDLDGVERARGLLHRMIQRCLRIPARDAGTATVRTLDAPLTEWIIAQFLDELGRLVRRGLRHDYRSVDDTLRYLRGRLVVARQLRQPPGRQHRFEVEHQVFLPDRPENRLLRSALDRALRATRDPDNWRAAHELTQWMSDIPHSTEVREDLVHWRDDRLSAHYRPVRPWCELLLSDKVPLAVAGEWRGRSLLFPMERLFERYVEACLRDVLPSDARLRAQVASRHLCRHLDADWFRLQPDLLLERAGRTWVIDTKWKRLDGAAGTPAEKYGISGSDFYQLFAYGHRYLPSAGDLLLVYPASRSFPKALAPFHFSPELTLHVVPFDLESGTLLADVAGIAARSKNASSGLTALSSAPL